MSKYIIRLDDASEKRDVEKWNRIEALLDKYGIKPLVGVIPECRDPMMEHYPIDTDFWNRVHSWEDKGWTIALHGCYHVYTTKSGGINPVNDFSEFADEPLDVQKERIRHGIKVLHSHGVFPKVFFAPAHTFDENTITALKEETDIRIISDTIANKPYCKDGMTYVPQQSGRARRVPINTVTFCYHPNSMKESSFVSVEKFLEKHSNKCIPFPNHEVNRKRSIYDLLLNKAYFLLRRR